MGKQWVISLSCEQTKPTKASFYPFMLNSVERERERKWECKNNKKK